MSVSLLRLLRDGLTLARRASFTYIAARFGGTGLLTAETLAAGLANERQLWFGNPANVGRLLQYAARELELSVHIAGV